VLPEFASGALKKAVEVFWVWARRCRVGGQGARSEANDDVGPGGDAAAG
jgi:hypothetical protein